MHGWGYMEWGGMGWMANRHNHTIGYKETPQAAPQKQYLQKTASSNKRSYMTAHWVVCTFAKRSIWLGVGSMYCFNCNR